MPKRRLLCVDDDSAIRKLYKNLFGSYGYDVSVAGSGRQALKIFLAGKIDAVVTDLEMPEMTGAELAGRLKRLRPELPVVLVSGSKSALAAPPHVVDVAIAKGAPVSELIHRVDTLLDTRLRCPAPLRPRRLIPLGSVLASIALVVYAVPRIWK